MRRSHTQTVRPALSAKTAARVATRRHASPFIGAAQPNHRVAGPRVDVAAAVEHARQAPAVDVPHVVAVARSFGLAPSALELHAGGPAREACEWLGARAFAVQNVVVFADASPSLALVRHELAHVVQQDGAARPAPERYGPGSLSLGDNVGRAEQEAQAAAERGTLSQMRLAAAAVYRADGDPAVPKAASEETKPESKVVERARKRLIALAEAARTTFQDYTAESTPKAKFGIAKEVPDPNNPTEKIIVHDPIFLISSETSWTVEHFTQAAKEAEAAQGESKDETAKDAPDSTRDPPGGESTYGTDLSDHIFRREGNKLAESAIATTPIQITKAGLKDQTTLVWATRAVPGDQPYDAGTAPITQHYAFVGAYRSAGQSGATRLEKDSRIGAIASAEIVNEIERLSRSKENPAASLEAYYQIISELIRTASLADPKKDLQDNLGLLGIINSALPQEDGAKQGAPADPDAEAKAKALKATAKDVREKMKIWILDSFTSFDEMSRIALNDERKVLTSGPTTSPRTKKPIDGFDYVSNWNPIKGDILVKFIERKASGKVELSTKQVYFDKNVAEGLDEDAQGDGFIVAGSGFHILESKAVTEGPKDFETNQMRRYAIIIKKNVPGFVFNKEAVEEAKADAGKSEDSANAGAKSAATGGGGKKAKKKPPPGEPKKPFLAAEYYIGAGFEQAGKALEVAKLWNIALYKAFKNPGEKPDPAAPIEVPPDGQVHLPTYMIHPKVGGAAAKETSVQLNPVLTLPITKPDQSDQSITDLPTKQPGVKIPKVDFKLARPLEAEIVSGTIVVAVDMAGQLKSPATPTAKPLQPVPAAEAKPEKPGGPLIYGKVENKFDKLSSALDKFLTERVTTDAKLTNTGVNASIAVSKGPSGIPKILLDAEVSATYDAGGLTAKGRLGLYNEKGNISSNITVIWESASKKWKITGSVKFTDIVDGLKPIEATFTYDPEKDVTQITVKQVGIEKQYGGVKLTGDATDLQFDPKTGDFSGKAALTADLGSFGQASVTDVKIDKSQIQGATLNYETDFSIPKADPKQKQKAANANSAVAGKVTGSLTYTAATTPGGQPTFDGNLKVQADIQAAALKKLSKDGNLGVAGTIKVLSTGAFRGSIGTTTALTLGQHLQILPFDATVKEDGAIELQFSLQIIEIGALEDAKATAQIDQKGFHLLGAAAQFKFGSDKDKVWGALGVLYEPGRKEGDLTVGGEINVRIKDDLIVTGKATYDVAKDEVNAELSAKEITLLKYGPQKHTLVDFSKQVELISFYKVIGLYLDTGFELAFLYEFDLRVKPTIWLVGFSFKTLNFTSATGVMNLLGKLEATLQGTPRIGLGVFVISTALLRGGGGIKVPITGKAALTTDKDTNFHVAYSPDGGLSAGATAGITLLFGVSGAITPYAEFSALDGAYDYKWQGADLTSFTLLKERPIFTYVVDFGKSLKTEDKPAIPSGKDAPAQPTATQKKEARPQGTPTQTEADTKKPAEQKTPEAKPAAGSEGGFDLKGLVDGLKDGESFKPLRKILEAAGEVWDAICNFIGRIVKFIRNWVGGLVDDITAAIKGIAKLGLIRYMKELLRQRLNPAVFHIVEPMLDAMATVEDDIYALLDTKLPTSAGELLEFAVDIIKKVTKLAWNDLTGLVTAIAEMAKRAKDATVDFMQYLVDTGRLGVRRSVRYIGFETVHLAHYMMVADQYKIYFAGISTQDKDDSILPTEEKAVAYGLWKALRVLNVTPTNISVDGDVGEPYNDYWVNSIQRQARFAAGIASDAPGAVRKAATEPGHPMPLGVRRRYEEALGADLDGILLHTGRASAAAANALDARAFTIGRHIHFADGAYAPGTESGDQLLAHELTHAACTPSAPRQRHGFEVAPSGAASERFAHASARSAAKALVH